MSIKTIALLVFDPEEAEWSLEQAATLAAAHDAHLTVLHPYNPMIFTDGTGAEPLIYASMQEWEEQDSEKIRAIFEKQAKAMGILGEYRPQTLLFGAEEFLLSGARGADIVLAGTNGTLTRSPDDRTLLERVVRNLGRPVLVLSAEASLTGPVARMTIGWSDTREATRAAHDALALAQDGAEIELVTVVSRAQRTVPGIDGKADFATSLDRLGFRVTVTERSATVEQRGETLISAAQEFGAEMLVTGAFGHSQLYDFVIGAVTRDLLEFAPLPVLLSK
ncbi:universal stress protein [Yangia mangrovi]|uniref:Universal stress protein n=1 Tax=Alloyangia mangrovi TaxID=1779329 RepID=A0A2A3JXA4_9RHOB|nr:universal stress protein [Alloyangia mangrovi]MCA0942102.1 universal stress protein [Alloyangia pacifica]MCA0947131.1 universal stress protein [Alloyangia pacifica]MCT4371091.1 universal stress protein [Alloyangia mangrovi]